MKEIKEEYIKIIERDFDVTDQNGEERIAYEYYLKISSIPFLEKSEAEQLKQQILQDHEDAKKYQKLKDLTGSQILDKWIDYQQIVKSLEEFYNDEELLLKSIVESDKTGSDQHLQILNLTIKIKKILEGKK